MLDDCNDSDDEVEDLVDITQESNLINLENKDIIDNQNMDFYEADAIEYQEEINNTENNLSKNLFKDKSHTINDIDQNIENETNFNNQNQMHENTYNYKNNISDMVETNEIHKDTQNYSNDILDGVEIKQMDADNQNSNNNITEIVEINKKHENTQNYNNNNISEMVET